MSVYPGGGPSPTSLPNLDPNAIAPVSHHIQAFAFTGADITTVALVAGVLVLVGYVLRKLSVKKPTSTHGDHFNK